MALTTLRTDNSPSLRYAVQRVLQLVHCLLETGLSPELADQLERPSDRIERRQLENPRVAKIDDPVVLVLGKQRFEHRPSLWSVLAKHVALAHILRAIVPCQGRAGVGDMADEIERVELRIHLVGEQFEPQSLILELVDDRLLALRAVPAAQKGV
jgi:hypothetical protein